MRRSFGVDRSILGRALVVLRSLLDTKVEELG